MPEDGKLLDGLSPERRELVRRLMARVDAVPSSTPLPQITGVLRDVAERGGYAELDAEDFATKDVIRSVYGAYHEGMRGGALDEHSLYMNLGYVADASPQHAAVSLPEKTMGRAYIKLVLETLGDCPIDGRRVLDVGCGRGGTLHALHRYYRPASTIGLDLTPGAVAFCQSRYGAQGTRFVLGDAENLPFADASVDVVTNIESSHHYANVDAFYRGVQRVLAPGGHFLCATLLTPAQFERDRATLAALGFLLERDTDITPNVLAACDRDGQGQFAALGSETDYAWLADAVSLPGSRTYTQMASGLTQYRVLKLCRG